MGVRVERERAGAPVTGVLSRDSERAVTSIEYLLVGALLVIVFASLRYTLLNLLLGLYKFFIEMICSPVL